MSVEVRIDGQPAGRLASYRDAMDVLGPKPDESRRTIDIWTHAPKLEPLSNDVALSFQDQIVETAWLGAGGAAISTARSTQGSVNRIRSRGSDVSVLNRTNREVPRVRSLHSSPTTFPLSMPGCWRVPSMDESGHTISRNSQYRLADHDPK